MAHEPIAITLTVNGIRHALEVTPERRLLDVIREELGLTGSKEGCGVGECGACSVLLGEPGDDKRLVNACLMPAFQADGLEVVTVEGLGSPESPSPVQAAFVAETASQCGYCTPGMVVAATKMLQDHPQVSREEARYHLAGNICRCTGYSQILNAVERARQGQQAIQESDYGVGVSAPRIDALDKVCGKTQYAADLPWPEGCLHGHTVRSQVAHARLVSLDASEALLVPGVVRVLTWQDVPGELHYGNAVNDQPVLVKDHIRFWGEAIALVLAETPEAARAGAEKVKVVVEPLPVLSTPAASLEPGAPQLHPDGNLLVHQKLRKGDLALGFAKADVVLARRYFTPSQEHLCLEPEVGLAIPDGDGIKVLAPSQNVFFDRFHLSRTMGLPKDKVRVIQTPTGAAFGSREDVYAQLHAALGAVITKRPVRVVWTREESQIVTTKRHPAWMDYKIGVTQDGEIVALEVQVLADKGAYASWGPNIGRKMLVHASGPYEIENISVDIRMAYTNNGVSGAFRGFGAPQVLFAMESLVEEAAAAVGMDPVAFRRRNHLAIGKITATGQTITGSCGLDECLTKALAAADKLAAARAPAPAHIARGRGISTIYYGIGYGNAIPDIGSAIVELQASGRFMVRCGAIEYGQGLLTTFTQIAGEALGVGRQVVEVMTGDSKETPDSGSTVASRQTYVSGEAVFQASERLKAELLTVASRQWSVPLSEISLGTDGVKAGETLLGNLEALYQACEAQGVKPRKQARFKANTSKLDLETGQGNAYWPYAFGVHVADVEVDKRTGQVRVISLVAAHDVGKAINPAMVEGQIVGGAAQGLGWALFEDHRLDRGRPLTWNLDTYRLPGFLDMPEVVSIIVEDPEPTGPYGAKGVGEPTLVAIAPAIANAVDHAVGVRVRELPIRAEVVRKALRERTRPTGLPLEITCPGQV